MKFLFPKSLKMNQALIVLALVVAVLSQERFYDRRYDYYDTETLIANPRLLKKYLNCFLDKGPCTPIGRVFKAVLPEVVATACGKCSPSQKRFARRTLDAFQRHHPEDYAQLINKLDPQNKYFSGLQRAISAA